MGSLKLADSYQFVLFLREELMLGQSTNTVINKYVQSHSDEFSQRLYRWYVLQQNNRIDEFFLQESRLVPFQRSLFLILQRGLQGQSITQPLIELIEEAEFITQTQLEEFIGRLPYKLMIPLLLLQFPALLLLLLGPLLIRMIGEFS